ncbi:MAG: class I SAM-dependent rRNA methyltransferase [Planctomycetota bacterium]
MKDVRLRGGPVAHPHVFDRRILRVERGARSGDVVRVRTREGRPVGYAFFHARSRIALRMLTYAEEHVPDTRWLAHRVREAARLRRDVLRLPEVTNAWRVVHAEGDGLSGLVVDRYSEVGSVALFSLGWQRRLDELSQVLREEAGFERLVVRADPRAARQEDLDLPPPRDEAPVEIVEHGLRFLVDPAGRHKTGFFLDQRENRRRLAHLAAGRTVFDGMTFAGGFALAAARGGATRVRGMDLDEEAVSVACENAKRNGVEIEFEHGDVFDALRAYARASEDERPEVLIVDPPKWARDRKGLGAALARYRDLNRLALEAVRPGGVVCTSSCSGLVSEEAFLDVVRGAARDSRRAVSILAVTGAAADHPVSAVFPEGRYLKTLFLHVGPPGSGPGTGASQEDGRRETRR